MAEKFVITKVGEELRDRVTKIFLYYEKMSTTESHIYKFQLYDDDEILCFEGLSSVNNSFDPLDKFGGSYGCTEIRYWNGNGYESLFREVGEMRMSIIKFIINKIKNKIMITRRFRKMVYFINDKGETNLKLCPLIQHPTEYPSVWWIGSYSCKKGCIFFVSDHPSKTIFHKKGLCKRYIKCSNIGKPFKKMKQNYNKMQGFKNKNKRSVC